MAAQIPFETTLVEVALRTINSFLKWDILRVLSDAPETMLSAAQIAARTRRPLAEVEDGLRALNEDRIVVAVRGHGETCYRITQYSGLRRTVDNFLAACRNRDFRLTVIQCLMRSEQPSTAAVARG
ncbi:MAG: hypothetical protein IPM16_19555 [Chloroflexi bacterium]|nr:hypothetical protein [Chloroflexota bacterium]